MGWVGVPVADLVTVLFRGRRMQIGTHIITFTGTSRGTDGDGSFITVHGHEGGVSRSQRFSVDGVVRVEK